MTVVDDQISAARRAAQTLQAAVTGLLQHYGGSADAVRLQLDARRVVEDLDLLCGPPVAAVPEPPAPVREVIPDTSYAHDFWMDAEDEGLGQWDGRGR